MNLKIMNSREKKRAAKSLGEEYGVDEGLFDGFVAMQEGGDVWIASEACLGIGLEGVKIDSIGLQVLRDGKPTVHGVQLLFKSAELTELDESEAKTFIDGGTIRKEGKIASYKGAPIDAIEAVKGGFRRMKHRV